MYWRRASFKTAKRSQAPGDATVLKRFFCDNFAIFRCTSKRIAVLELVIFFYMCLYANFRFSWWSRDHFSAAFRGLYLPNAWSQTLQTSKRHTFRVSAFHRYHWFGGKTVSCRMCAGQSRGTLKREKCCFWICLRPRYKIPEFITIAPSSPRIWRFVAEIAAICRLYIRLRVRYKYYKKNIVALVWPGAAHAPIAV